MRMEEWTNSFIENEQAKIETIAEPLYSQRRTEIIDKVITKIKLLDQLAIFECFDQYETIEEISNDLDALNYIEKYKEPS